MAEDYWPDLRRAGTHAAADASPWFLWSSPRMVELTALDAFRSVLQQLPPAPARLLEVGSGDGWLALELARAGYRVLGLEPDSERVALARRVAADMARPPDYACVPLEDWEPEPGAELDAVVCHLSLHHVRDLPGGVAKLRRALRPGGRLICVEFAYDRLDGATARWLHQVESRLQLEDAAAAPELLRSAWLARYEEHELHGFEAMRAALGASFQERQFSWAPYLFVRIGNRLPGADRDKLGRWISQIKDLEAQAIAAGRIQAVQFRYAGERA